ncbi:sec-independent protein translocase protein TatA [Flavobacterium sp. 103]|uniref:Sec-independent protein translocase subunit TatA/TatB n=1 Tax=unclassified Flavobacterium TaxID=196869 RepID=UPI000D5ED4B1|nr:MULTISPECIES: twin-arginine translocase TatA/TatE family subunit [unclassified Flavobacterium]PVX45254.1 sec-independent protein translocase protein TatA [Flavobacterium sp. 103]QKJ62593.1 twin-arginine translocase TatA/TatE family subunit [Flavobacterium sp. M31R6]
MFGIGGGELVFIMFIVLMLFGSDKVPEIARTMGKAMAQLKNATNDIKSEIQKGAEANGFDQKTLDSLTGGINSEINKVKTNLLGETSNTLNGITETFSTEVNKTKDSVLSGTKNPDGTTVLDDLTGPIKRQM